MDVANCAILVAAYACRKVITALLYKNISPSVGRLRDPLTTGRGNPGDEVLDDQFNFSNARRRSNSSGYANNLQDFKTKFELNEVEPVFEEYMANPDEELTKTDSASTSGASTDENPAKSV